MLQYPCKVIELLDIRYPRHFTHLIVRCILPHDVGPFSIVIDCSTSVDTWPYTSMTSKGTFYLISNGIFLIPVSIRYVDNWCGDKLGHFFSKSSCQFSIVALFRSQSSTHKPGALRFSLCLLHPDRIFVSQRNVKEHDKISEFSMVT